jgi:hypothetical protein
MKRWMWPGLLTLALVGCAGVKGPIPTHPVEGRIFYDGQPAVGVQVFLLPTSAPMVPDVPTNPRGITGPDGRFTLGTYTQTDGAAEGGYQVVLLWIKEPEPGAEATDEDRLLGWYSGVHSKLTVQVKPGTNQLPEMRLPAVTKPPAAVEGVPGRN